jgi:endonuclease G
MFLHQPIDGLMKPIVALLLALTPASAQAPFGSPACPGEPAGRVFFFVCYSPAHKTPLWVAHTLTPEQLDGAAAPRPSRFRQDRGLASPSAADRDYRSSGFHRGHLARRRLLLTRRRPRHLPASNAVPQKPSVNTGPWRRIENVIRGAAHAADRVHVFTGALFEGEPKTIGQGQVAVPSHTYKVVLFIQGDSAAMFAAIVPNQDDLPGPLDRFAVTVNEIEQRTGLDFFS